MHARVRPVPAGDSSQAATPPDDTTLQGAYERHHSRVFDLCYHYLGQVADAEDAVQETFARAARRLPSLTGDRGAYLLAVARNLCCNELRRRRRVVPVECIDREDRGVEAERGIVERAVLERLWVRLSPRERSLIHDTFAGFSQQEIAGRIGLSPNAVAVALLRARQRARTYASRALAAFFPLALAWRWAQRAVRRAAAMPAEASAAIGLQIQQVGMVITAAIVGSLTAAPVVGSMALTGASLPQSPAAAGAVESAAPLATGSRATPGTAETDLQQSPTASGALAGTGAASGVLDPLVAPGRNAPAQQVFFTSFTPSPSYSSDHTVFASGYFSHGCQAPTSCAVLYKTTDAGRTWHNTNVQSFAGGTLLLPPSWPRDRTMFAMGPSGLQRSDDDAVFSLAVPVSGAASVAPDSVPGDARVLIAASPMLVYSAAGKGSVAPGPVMPAGVSLPDDVAFVGDSRHIEATAEVLSSSSAAGQAQTGAVVQCVSSTCTVVKTTPGVWQLRLAVSPWVAADRTVVAVSRNTVLRSADGGATFTMAQAAVPAGGQPLATFSGGPGSTDLVLAGFDSRQQVLIRMGPAGSASRMPSGGLPTQAPLGALVALPDGRLLAAGPEGGAQPYGVLILSAGAAAWQPSD